MKRTTTIEELRNEIYKSDIISPQLKPYFVITVELAYAMGRSDTYKEVIKEQDKIFKEAK
jgi:hypothetical protein